MALNTQQLEKVQALIAKANSTEFPEEAEALFAKAAALMEKYDLTNEDLRQQEAKMAGLTAADEEIVYWMYEIDTIGGHAKARMAAVHSVVVAMGARGFFNTGEGTGYRKTTHYTVIGQASVVDNLKIFIPTMMMRAETLSEAHGKAAIRAAKLDGTFYSNTGCNARRGYMRGFGSGVANRLRSQRDTEVAEGPDSFALVLRNRRITLDEHMKKHHSNLSKGGRGQKYDSASFRAGMSAGTAFGSPGVSSGSRRAIGTGA